ncbi:HAD-IA family hydrolase [Enterovirga rhinocerotis]|uniref:Phosphoglycolate phosphatase n=1 Tax=Enterovirga rhinocerotis TaxID=1339210 RepID=A0A4R7CAD3_9HYPH|nr:HAD-IA family hydrolase [Enterovirga rhinocerotis]TDR94335.1 phosphoglycolate phosphatase [Enterovirga rhinocerotis]
MQLVVLDVDGTLVDSQALIVEAQRRAFSACGLEPPTRERSLSIVGLSLREAFLVLVGPSGPYERLGEEYKLAFQALRTDPAWHEPLFPGIEAMVARLARSDRFLLGIATGKSRRGVDYLVRRHGWDGLFSTIQTADDAPSKPHPAMLRQALAEAGVAAEDAVMVGDTTFDMAMARAAGVRAIGVTWGYHPLAALEEAGAEILISRIEDLAPLIGLDERAPSHG